jgi:hypothetical protein
MLAFLRDFLTPVLSFLASFASLESPLGNDKTGVKKSRKKASMKNQGGGTEEVLGSIDDFPTLESPT